MAALARPPLNLYHGQPATFGKDALVSALEGWVKGAEQAVTLFALLARLVLEGHDLAARPLHFLLVLDLEFFQAGPAPRQALVLVF